MLAAGDEKLPTEAAPADAKDSLQETSLSGEEVQSPPPPLTLHSILERAIASQFGVRVTTDDVDRFRREVYATRQNLGPEYSSLVVRISPLDKSEVWILRGKVNGEADRREED